MQNFSQKISSFAIDFTVTQSSVYIVNHSTARRAVDWRKEKESFLFMLSKLDLWSKELIFLSLALERSCTALYMSCLFSVYYSYPDEYEFGMCVREGWESFFGKSSFFSVHKKKLLHYFSSEGKCITSAHWSKQKVSKKTCTSWQAQTVKCIRK